MVADVPANIVQQEQVGPGQYRLTLYAPAIASYAVPGQFVYIRCADSLDPLLRRPLSIHGVNRKEGKLFLLYQVVGRGTALLAARRRGERLGVMGPLGRGFTLPEPGRRVILVGGGIGVAPLVFLGHELVQRKNQVCLLVGARSADQLPVGKKGYTVPFDHAVATDDGSCGHHGSVTDLLEKMLAGEGADMVYACGPRGMLRQTALLLVRYNVPGEFSLEERMCCGVGACLSCVCKTAGNGGKPFEYRRVCVEGPVFRTEQLVWD
ncbi:dihydroorotate dehydrogenase electron transfer subunit [Desulfofundulus thermosubterraneus]|uniref:Dihydroorotate dehydrogenase B (NAD(+)), electron transfer subunit n=1 Tax=Desulfofundulus thermosubterraneus DSM 16057 TaxID=1121432 RepID=A0A1M6BSY5_9FIRM|nr:dihydroorotate dehydrogenase electron transfer subunit [Desulfofundulus thermosubterraneus]SHI51704.1 dihydroorotate dehydrogenase electron transfer subunit [Desulfofundulus thermosubterraneus DSM 16057]